MPLHSIYRWPMTAQQNRLAVVGKTAAPTAVATGIRQPTQAAAASKSTPVDKSVTVRIDGMRFQPASITIEPGTTVTWIHGGQMPHTVTGNTDRLRSRTLYKGQKFSHTFNLTGKYKYFCDFHPSMRGSVVVEEVGTDT